MLGALGLRNEQKTAKKKTKKKLDKVRQVIVT
jgi:hypothetical protein